MIVEHTDGAPERRVSRVTIDCLLEGFIGSIEVTSDHVNTAQVVPRVGIARVDLNRLREVLESNVEILLERLLALSTLTLFVWRGRRLRLRVQAAQLLQNLGVVGIHLQHLLVGLLGAVPILLLLEHRANLEPHVWLGQWVRWVRQNVLEALQSGRKHALVLIDNA